MTNSDQTWYVILRLLHIASGVFWAGAVIYMAAFIIPAVKALGPDGGKFMQQLSRTNRLPLVMTIMPLTNVVAGVILFWKLSSGFQSAWMSSEHGMILSTGGGLAIIAFFISLFVNRPIVVRISHLGQAMAKQGSPSTAEQTQQLMVLRKKLFAATNIVALLLALTVVAMSIAKYF
ncbi:MAG: hypothetical protein ACHQEB_03350 [Chitinophagales bacterium]